MERLVALVKTRRIWTPSPLRMLRLVNGKRCERCNKGKVNTVSEAFGVFFCFDGCMQDRYSKCVRRNNKWNCILHHVRVARSDFSSVAYIWTTPVRDSQGRPYGPLISKTDMEKIHHDGGKKVTSIDQLLERRDAQDTLANQASSIVEAFDSCEEDAANRIKEKANKKKLANHHANQVRIQKTNAIIHQLEELVDDDKPWKCLLRHHSTQKNNSKEYIQFQCPLLEQHLHPLALAPSKATKKKLQEVVDILTEQFDMIISTGFYDLSFLDQYAEEHHQDDKNVMLEHLLWRHFRMEGANQIVPRLPLKINAECLALVQKEKLLDALDSIAKQEIRKVISSRWVSTIPSSVLDSPAPYYHDEESSEEQDDGDSVMSVPPLRSKAHLLANTLLRHGPYNENVVTCFQRYQESFPQYFQSCVDFLQDPETARGLPNDRAQRVWNGNPGVMSSLIERDFAKTQISLQSPYERWLDRHGDVFSHI
eukprot:CAMPEP_0172467914 /NCGR_PEP_ID=MMETSP1065-20121228/60147_1 /TAXON_ID=265537 /ORGANISM="Amphiprora paludosa, Strain CCMP125" /LENGTH=479 /DNA_ID=CAMNT_0013225179 /DNA_START=31 /DNA_END=1470 /DNA_ORIENTATION=+